MSDDEESTTGDVPAADAPASGRRWTGGQIAAIVVSVVLAAGFVVGLIASKHQKDDEKKSGVGGGVVATVDGVPISRSQLLDEVDTWVANQAYVAAAKQQNEVMLDHGQPAAGFEADILTQQISDVLISREFNNRHLKVTPTDEAQLRQQVAGNPALAAYPKPFLDAIIARAARTSVLQQKFVPNDALYQRAYDDQFACPSGRDVSHILVNTLAEANAIETQLQHGAKFATLAATKSIDTGSGPNGGALGCLKRGDFVAPFENAAFAAKFNTPTAPVKSQFGYHIILVTPHSAKSNPPLASVRSQLLQSGAVFNAFLETTFAKAKVVVDPAFGTWKLSGGRYVVVPPAKPGHSGTTTPTTAASVVPLPVVDGRPHGS